jgi:hypothetical protein
MSTTVANEIYAEGGADSRQVSCFAGSIAPQKLFV